MKVKFSQLKGLKPIIHSAIVNKHSNSLASSFLHGRENCRRSFCHCPHHVCTGQTAAVVQYVRRQAVQESHNLQRLWVFGASGRDPLALITSNLREGTSVCWRLLESACVCQRTAHSHLPVFLASYSTVLTTTRLNYEYITHLILFENIQNHNI